MKNTTKNSSFIFILLIGISAISGFSFSKTASADTNLASTTIYAISIVDNSFSPPNVMIPVGSTILWTNNGSVAHTVTSDNSDVSTMFSSGSINPGATFGWTFNKAGVYPYYCSFHGGPGGVGMSGSVVVGTPQPPESQSSTTPAGTAPTISNVNQSVSGDGTAVTITWTTDIPATSQIQYGPQPTNLTSSTTPDNTLTTDHSVTLSGLAPNNTYYFQRVSGSDSGANTTSPIQTFTTTVSANGTTPTPPTGIIPPPPTNQGGSPDLQAIKYQIQQIEQEILIIMGELKQYLNASGHEFYAPSITI